MKRGAFTFMALTLCLGFAGCRSKPKMDSDKSMFDYMQKEVAKITDKGGMAAVGLGESRTTDLAISRAKLEARKNLAQLVQVKINNLEKAFAEEIGEASSSEINKLFSSATKQITSQKISGSAPKMQKYETKDGITTAYILMVLDPKIVDASLKQNNAQHLYERFRASKAFDELDKEIKAYQEAELKGL
jgi:hypothetical protein